MGRWIWMVWATNKDENFCCLSLTKKKNSTSTKHFKTLASSIHHYSSTLILNSYRNVLAWTTEEERTVLYFYYVQLIRSRSKPQAMERGLEHYRTKGQWLFLHIVVLSTLKTKRFLKLSNQFFLNTVDWKLWEKGSIKLFQDKWSDLQINFFASLRSLLRLLFFINY